ERGQAGDLHRRESRAEGGGIPASLAARSRCRRFQRAEGGMRQDTGQLGFDALLSAAAEDNRKRKTERETAHLPGTMAEAIPYYRLLIRQPHAAVLAADADKVTQLRREADLLALRLNDGEPGILAHEGAPGRVLTRETAAPSGAVPLWGQEGGFIITVGRMRV